MAQLSSETSANIVLIKTQCLFIINLATQSEWKLFNSFGEIEETLIVLSELKTVGDEAIDAFSRLSSLQLRVATAQPEISPALVKLVIESKDRIEIRIPAWQRSVEEILTEWRLS